MPVVAARGPRESRTGSFAFLLGTGRCGSTIVAQVLALHPDVGFISNFDDRFAGANARGRLNNRTYRSLPRQLMKLGGRRGGQTRGAFSAIGMTPSEGYRLLERHVSPMLVAPCRDLTVDDAHPWITTRLSEFFGRRAEAQGCRVFLHKFTGWPRAGLLNAVFPDAPLVHVVRDGRAVASSLLQQPWWPGFGGPQAWSFGDLSTDDRAAWEASGRSFTVLAGLEWKILMNAFSRARDSVPAERWLELRYEDVVARPREHVELLLAHVGLEWTAGFERAFSRLRWITVRRDAYRKELSSVDVSRLEAVLGSELRLHGY
jgi:hypothetical protein